VHTPDQASLVAAMCPGEECWVGLQRSYSSPLWEWVDGTDANYAPWGLGEPSSIAADATVVLTAGTIPGLRVLSSGGVVERSGVCLRDGALNSGKWWLTKVDEDKLLRPWGIAVAPDGARAVVSDAASNKIFVLEIETGEVHVLAGQRAAGTDDGVGPEARFWRPRGVAFAPDGRTVYVADSANHLIRAVSYPEGVVTTFAGKVRQGDGRQGVRGGALALGWVSWSGTKVAMFSEPHDVAVSPEP